MESEHGPEVGHNLVAKNINIFERFRDNEDTSSAFPIFIWLGASKINFF